MSPPEGAPEVLAVVPALAERRPRGPGKEGLQAGSRSASFSNLPCARGVIAAAYFDLAPMARRRTHAANAEIGYQALSFASSALRVDAPAQITRPDFKTDCRMIAVLISVAREGRSARRERAHRERKRREQAHRSS